MKGFVDLEIRFKLCLRLGCSHWRAWLSHLLPLQFHVDFLIPLGFLINGPAHSLSRYVLISHSWSLTHALFTPYTSSCFLFASSGTSHYRGKNRDTFPTSISWLLSKLWTW